jgi:molybdate transport system substrate-binding protein
MMTRLRWWPLGSLVLALLASSCAGRPPADRPSDVVRAAVAGNFAAPQRALARRFRETSGIRVETSIGSTGQLYAQIANGAPYDVFLAADTIRPHRLEAEGLAVPGSRFTYAVGRVVLYAPGWDSIGSGRLALRTRAFQHLAIANPETAPYGTAARAVLMEWGLWDSMLPRVVRAENVAQAFQFVESGAAEVGIVALSQVTDRNPEHYAVLPNGLYPPIQQDAVLLRPGEDHPGAQAFLSFLRSDAGRQVIARYGYQRP